MLFKGFFIVLLIQLGFLVLPGPDFYSVIRFAIKNGKKAGIVCTTGITLGILWNTFFVYILGEKLHNGLPLAYLLIMSMGCAYILYMAIQLIISAYKNTTTTHQDTNNNTNNTIIKAFIGGFISNITNIKLLLSLSTILPLIIHWPTHIILILWFLIVMITFLWFTFVSIIFTKKKIRNMFLKKIRLIEFIIGTILILFAGGIIFEYIIPAVNKFIHQ